MAVLQPGILTCGDETRELTFSELSLRWETEELDATSGSWVYRRHPKLLLVLELGWDKALGFDEVTRAELFGYLPSDPPATLAGLVLSEPQDEVEAWWGYKSGELTKNRIEVLSCLSGAGVELAWSFEKKSGEVLAFGGLVNFEGLSMKVCKEGDAQGIVARTWPRLDWESLAVVGEVEVEATLEGPDSTDDPLLEDGVELPSNKGWLELHFDFQPPGQA